jgi:hypothetical protein
LGDQKNPGGDEGWWLVHSELGVLHATKAEDYGTEEDALANYVQASDAVGEPDEFTCWLRILEKTHRALNMIRAGRANDNLEGADVASLAIGAEALRRRRLG